MSWTDNNDVQSSTPNLRDLDHDERWGVITDLVNKQLPEYCMDMQETIAALGGNPDDFAVALIMSAGTLPMLALQSTNEHLATEDLSPLDNQRNFAVELLRQEANGLKNLDLTTLGDDQ